MSRNMTTRTIESTVVKVLGMDVVEQEPAYMTITLPNTYKDDAKLMKALAKHNTDTFKIVTVLEKEVKKELRGITDELFLKYSVVLDENRKPIELDKDEQ